jgi:hypothetical protein
MCAAELTHRASKWRSKPEIVSSATRKFLVATVRVKNVGLSMIALPRSEGSGAGPRGCALLVTPLHEDDPTPDLFEADWDDIRAFDILEHHRTIEPGLTINQQKLICLPNTAHDARSGDRDLHGTVKPYGGLVRGAGAMQFGCHHSVQNHRLWAQPAIRARVLQLEEEKPEETKKIEELKRQQRERRRTLDQQRKKESSSPSRGPARDPRAT